jgi:hypothetical protein
VSVADALLLQRAAGRRLLHQTNTQQLKCEKCEKYKILKRKFAQSTFGFSPQKVPPPLSIIGRTPPSTDRPDSGCAAF